jgi:hypothetical protein
MKSVDIITIKGRFWTHGNFEIVRDKPMRIMMDPDLIREAASLEAAIEVLKASAPAIDEVLDLEYFEIGGVRYTAEHWRR